MNKSDYMLARRYATAALQTVARALTLDEALVCMRAGQRLARTRQWLSVLALPGISLAQKEHMRAHIKKDAGVPAMLDPIIDLLYEHRRLEILPDVLCAIARLFFAQHAVLRFNVKSLPVLDDAQRGQVHNFLQRISGKRAMCEFVEDVTLLAGIRVESETLLWEYSVAKKLREAQQMVDKDMV